MKRFKITYVYKHDREQVHPATIEGEDRDSAARHFIKLNAEYGVEIVTLREVHKGIYTFYFAPPFRPTAVAYEPEDLPSLLQPPERLVFHAEGWDRDDAWLNANAQFRVWLWEKGYRE